MAESNKPFKERVNEARKKGFTPSFDRVAEYIETNLLNAALSTASMLARANEVDPATVVRMSQRLGYRGYPELRAELAASHENLAKLLLLEGREDWAEKHRMAAERVPRAAESAAQARQIAPIRFQSFADPAGLQLLGGASVAKDQLRLTPPSPNSAGAAWTGVGDAVLVAAVRGDPAV